VCSPSFLLPFWPFSGPAAAAGDASRAPLVWLLAAKLQGKTVRRSYFFFSYRVEEAEKLREVVRKSPGKKKKVHLYNQHQVPLLVFLICAIFFYLIPLQSTRLNTQKFFFFSL
jgi:hypothetical protein